MVLTVSFLFVVVEGGNAYLTLDNIDEPYLAGCRYTAVSESVSQPVSSYESVSSYELVSQLITVI